MNVHRSQLGENLGGFDGLIANTPLVRLRALLSLLYVIEEINISRWMNYLSRHNVWPCVEVMLDP